MNHVAEMKAGIIKVNIGIEENIVKPLKRILMVS